MYTSNIVVELKSKTHTHTHINNINKTKINKKKRSFLLLVTFKKFAFVAKVGVLVDFCLS